MKDLMIEDIQTFKEIDEENLSEIVGGWVTYSVNLATDVNVLVATEGITAAEIAGVVAVVVAVGIVG